MFYILAKIQKRTRSSSSLVCALTAYNPWIHYAPYHPISLPRILPVSDSSIVFSTTPAWHCIYRTTVTYTMLPRGILSILRSVALLHTSPALHYYAPVDGSQLPLQGLSSTRFHQYYYYSHCPNLVNNGVPTLTLPSAQQHANCVKV